MDFLNELCSGLEWVMGIAITQLLLAIVIISGLPKSRTKRNPNK